MNNYYIAKIYAAFCSIEIRVNDVALLRREVYDEITAMLPVNHLIEKSGLQTLSVTATPLAKELENPALSSFDVKILRCDSSSGKLVPAEEMCAATSQSAPDAVPVSLPRISKAFMADVPYRIDRWGDCRRIEHGRNVAREAADFFLNVGQTLAAGNYEAYAQMVNNREVAVCTALYQGSHHVAQRNKILIDTLAKGFVYTPITGKKIIEYYAHDKLITILDEDRQSALRFENPVTGEIMVLDLLLGYNGHDRQLTIR